MPRISAFYGIVITMYYADHSPPHFHARYGEFQAQIEISTGRILNGRLPNRAAQLVDEWCQLHWDLAIAERPLVTIDPLP
jgi:hypothetical protein